MVGQGFGSEHLCCPPGAGAVVGVKFPVGLWCKLRQILAWMLRRPGAWSPLPGVSFVLGAEPWELAGSVNSGEAAAAFTGLQVFKEPHASKVWRPFGM